MQHNSAYDTLKYSIMLNFPRRRGRYRIPTRGLSIYLDDAERAFDIRDLSTSGCNLHAPAELLAVGRICNCDLHIGNASYLTDLKLKVIRHITFDSVACIFQSLSSRQESTLDKLLLELQKRSIATHAVRRRRKKNP